MTLGQTERLLTILRTHGVNHFKTNDIEIRFSSDSSAVTVIPVGPASPQAPVVPRGTGLQSQDGYQQAVQSNMHMGKRENIGDVPQKEMKIPHQLNEMVSLLKMSDEDLVDKMFPEGAPPPNQNGGE